MGLMANKLEHLVELQYRIKSNQNITSLDQPDEEAYCKIT